MDVVFVYAGLLLLVVAIFLRWHLRWSKTTEWRLAGVVVLVVVGLIVFITGFVMRNAARRARAEKVAAEETTLQEKAPKQGVLYPGEREN